MNETKYTISNDLKDIYNKEKFLVSFPEYLTILDFYIDKEGNTQEWLLDDHIIACNFIYYFIEQNIGKSTDIRLFLSNNDTIETTEYYLKIYDYYFL